MVVTTALVAVSITDTVFGPMLATYTWSPSGATARPQGFLPTGIVVTTALIVVSITDTVADLELVT